MDRSKRLVLSVTEAAEVLGISRTLAYELVGRQELPSMRLGGRIVIPLGRLENMLEAGAPDGGAS